MDVNNVEIKDGDPILPTTQTAPSSVEVKNSQADGSNNKKKRRRGKSKRKIMKPFMKISWQDRRKNDKTKRNNRFRKIVLAKTHAPFNNNQFLMEIHKPEPENSFNAFHTPSARTRDSSFSIDSEDNYFYSLPEDEEEYLTKEFSSVYEDAQTERLSSMSKTDLVQEYLLLEAKYENLVKRTERCRPRTEDDSRDPDVTDKDASVTDKDSLAQSSTEGDTSIDDIMQRIKEQEDQIRDLQLANEKLRAENENLRQRSQDSSSKDSESDSSSTSVSSSSSSNRSRSRSPVGEIIAENGEISNGNHNGVNGEQDDEKSPYPLVNGFHSPHD